MCVFKSEKKDFGWKIETMGVRKCNIGSIKQMPNSDMYRKTFKREEQKNEKDSTDMDEESLDMKVFDMFTGKHNEIVSKNDDDLMSITNNVCHFEQTNEPDKCYLKIIIRIIMMKLLTHLLKQYN
jgi:hypothetical protein